MVENTGFALEVTLVQILISPFPAAIMKQSWGLESESGEWERKKLRGEKVAGSKPHTASQRLRWTPAVAKQPFPLLRLIPAC